MAHSRRSASGNEVDCKVGCITSGARARVCSKRGAHRDGAEGSFGLPKLVGTAGVRSACAGSAATLGSLFETKNMTTRCSVWLLAGPRTVGPWRFLSNKQSQEQQMRTEKTKSETISRHMGVFYKLAPHHLNIRRRHKQPWQTKKEYILTRTRLMLSQGLGRPGS